jgi:CheY-like chemotaxis protein
MTSRELPYLRRNLPTYSGFVGNMPTIMVIDDSAADLCEIRRAFSSVGVSNPLLLVRSDDEAKRYLSGAYPYNDQAIYPVPSVIILDLSQPAGFELLTWIRNRFPNGGLLIVALTRLEEIRKISRAYALGANSFLTKPVQASELRELINIFGGYWLVNAMSHYRQEEIVNV